jgi:Thylakoid formation protein
MITDIVGTTHLVVVNARFTRDPIWSLGMVKSLELLLKNYPEPDMRAKIESSLFEAVGLNEAEIRAEAAKALSWVDGKSRAVIESALAGEGSSELASVAKTIQGEEFWMYNRFFGIGLLQFMEIVGIASDKDEAYPIMEDWMSKKLQKSHLTACGDSDLYFRIREKLDMMETMMKEIEIREKKRMAERLEEKADAALRAAEREGQLAAEIAAEATKQRERVASS